MTFIYGRDSNMVTYLYGLSHLLWRLVTKDFFNKVVMISQINEIESIPITSEPNLKLASNPAQHFGPK